MLFYVNLKIDYFYLNLRNVVNISPTKTYNTPTKSFFHARSVDTFWSSWTSIVIEIQQVKDVRIIMGQTLVRKAVKFFKGEMYRTGTHCRKAGWAHSKTRETGYFF